MYVLRGYIAARAQLVTFILFTFTIYFIEKFLATKQKRYAVGLILIPLAIANLHVAVFPFYFVLYLPYVAEYLLAIMAEVVLYRKTDLFLINLKIKQYSKKVGQQEKVEKLNQKQKEMEA